MKTNDKLILIFLWKNIGPQTAQHKMCTDGTKGKGKTLPTRHQKM